MNSEIWVRFIFEQGRPTREVCGYCHGDVGSMTTALRVNMFLVRPAREVVRADETAFDVIRRMWRRNAIVAVVVRGHGIPRGSDAAGVITKEHVADSVADSVKAYRQ